MLLATVLLLLTYPLGLVSVICVHISLSQKIPGWGWLVAKEMFSSQITFLQYGQQETYQLRMMKRSKKKRLREKNAQGQLLLYQVVVQLPDFLSLKLDPGHPSPPSPSEGKHWVSGWGALLPAESHGSSWAGLWVLSCRKRGDQSVWKEAGSSLGMVEVVPGARIRLCCCIRNDKCEEWESWCFVEIFQVKQYGTKSLLFCLASIPSLYAYQRIHLYFFKHVAFSTTKLWLFNDAQ